MDTIDLTQLNDIDNEVPDTPHIEIMFDALNDTLTGTEGMELTEAQQYANGVLFANSSRVSGNESFFGTIAAGVKSTYDYIIKMFKSIWGFFFKRDVVEQSQEAKKEVEAVIEKVKEAPAPSPEKAKEPTKPAEDKIAKAYEKVVELNTKFDAMMNTVTVRPKDAPRIGDPGPNSKAKASSEKIGHACREYEPEFKRTLTTLKVSSFGDKAPALVMLSRLLVQITAGEKLAKALKDEDADIGAAIKALEKAMNAGPLNEHDKNDLDLLRVVMKMGSTVAQYLGHLFKAQQALAKELGHFVYG